MIGNHCADVEAATKHCHHFMPGLEHFAAVNSFQADALEDRLVQVYLGHIRIYAKQRDLATMVDDVDQIMQRVLVTRHFKANIEALSKPPLPKRDLQRLKEIFGKVDSVTGG